MAQIEELVDEFLTKDEGDDFLRALQAKIEGGGLKLLKYQKLPVFIAEKLSRLQKEMPLGEIYERVRPAFYKRPVVRLTLAFTPPEAFLREIVNWLSQNAGQKVIIDLEVDQSIIGGVRIFCNDHYKDFSIVSKLEEGFSAERPETPQPASPI